MLTAAFHMLRDGTEYNDLGSEHFDRQDKSQDHPPPAQAASRPRLRCP
jgi:hypothetical protein